MPPPSPADVIASCSFCGKPDTMVQRLVAGPGVYICNECVELSAMIVEDAARTTPEESSRRRARFYDRPTQEILPMLPALVSSSNRIEAELVRWIDRLRARGTEWQTIADALGMSLDEARRRFETPSRP